MNPILCCNNPAVFLPFLSATFALTVKLNLCILPTCGNPASIPDSSVMAIFRKVHVYRSGVLAIVASTNGLLCLMCGVKIEDVLIDIFPIVCNPATRERELMPYDIKLSRNTIGHGFGLAFDPSAKPASYKLVQVLLMHSSSMSKKFGMISVYSSDTGRWIKSKDYVSISSFEKVSKYFLYKKSVFIRGVIYWKLSHDLLYYDIDNDAAGTLSFSRRLDSVEDVLLSQELLAQSLTSGCCLDMVTTLSGS